MKLGIEIVEKSVEFGQNKEIALLKVIYGSNYGHARKYAEAFARDFNVEARSYKDFKHHQKSDLIIYFGALYAGGVKGLASLKGKDNQLVLATVGLADPRIEENRESIEKSIMLSIKKNKLRIIKVFHLRGGIDYKNLGPHHKLMMALVYQKLKHTPEEDLSDEDKTMIKTYGSKVDFVDVSTLGPMIDYIREKYLS